MSVWANFADIYLRGMRDRSMLGAGNPANWLVNSRRTRQTGFCRNLFHFSQREKIVQVTYQFKFFTLRFVSRKKLKKKFVLTNNFFFFVNQSNPL